jgi:hypothetical protein
MSPQTVADVVARMRAIDDKQPAGDGAKVFNSVYLRVTVMMLDRLTAGVAVDHEYVSVLGLPRGWHKHPSVALTTSVRKHK